MGETGCMSTLVCDLVWMSLSPDMQLTLTLNNLHVNIGFVVKRKVPQGE